MAETILLEFGKLVLGQLGSLAVEELKLVLGLEDEVDSIKSNLSSIQAVLRDAEKQQTTSESIKNWLGKLQDVMYDIDDLLDDITTEVKLRAKNKGQLRKQVRKFFSRTNNLLLRSQWAHEIKSLSKKLDRIAFEKQNFVLSTDSVDSEESSLRETHSKLDKSDLILGRDDDKEAVMRSILSCGDCDGLSVVPIVGFGGVGKTTLAQLIYNDTRIDDTFDQKLWVYVSEKFRIKKVLKQVISMATGENILQLTIEQHSLESLRIKMSDALRGKKYLLVLDDLWNEDSNEWRSLKRLLDVGAKGSTVVVTTRDSKVASITHTVEECRLEELSHEVSLQLFKQLAFKDGVENIKPALLNLANKIVEMSKGLPLLVTTLGKLLHGETDEEKWGRIIQKLEQGHQEILNALKLSYDQLISNSKLCFRFLTLFKGSESFFLINLVPLWMALGYIPSDGEGEALGKDCVEELLSKSLLTEDEISVGGLFDFMRKFCVHDLVYDLAKSVAGKEFATITCSTKEVSEKVRYIELDEDDLLGKQFHEGLLDKAKKARFFKVNTPQPLSKPFLKFIISSFPFLRVLSLYSCQFEELPRTIGYMKHLRYLDLNGNMRIRYLPNSICNLINLQTLLLNACTNLQELPTDIGRLENLTTLSVTTQQELLPKGIGHIKGLRTLYITDCPRLAFLPTSTSHLENLDLLFIDDCVELDLANGSWSLEGLNNLRTLGIGSHPKFNKLSMGVQGLPFTSLQHLLIGDCKGLIELGDWIKCFTSLKTLSIYDCPNLERLSHTISLLDKLEMLTINNCPSEWLKTKESDGMHLIYKIPNIYIDGQKIIKIPSRIIWGSPDQANSSNHETGPGKA